MRRGLVILMLVLGAGASRASAAGPLSEAEKTTLRAALEAQASGPVHPAAYPDVRTPLLHDDTHPSVPASKAAERAAAKQLRMRAAARAAAHAEVQSLAPGQEGSQPGSSRQGGSPSSHGGQGAAASEAARSGALPPPATKAMKRGQGPAGRGHGLAPAEAGGATSRPH